VNASSGQLAALDGLRVAPEAAADSYDRDLFGGGWIDADGDGCDTRCEVLEAERIALPGGGSGWLSLYDSYSTDDPSELDVDHMVPLAEAWRSGASSWDPKRRIAYANDLAAPTSLIAVTAATNRAKSDRDPARWQPSSLDAWCSYTDAWIGTKQRWGLTADAAEVKAIHNMIVARRC